MPRYENDERLENFKINNTTIEHLHRYAMALALVRDKNVLDIACGEGYGSYFLAQNAANVIGVDIDASTITKAKGKYRKSNLTFKAGSVLEIPGTDKHFDIVISFETLEHVAEQDKMLKEIKRVLKPEGVVIISTPDKRYYSDETGNINPYHLKELYAPEFKSLIQCHFHNATFLQQSFISGSLLAAEKQNHGFSLYTGDNNVLFTKELPTPLYHIAVASDYAVPQLDTSLFYNQEFIQKLIYEKEAITKTMTYRVGNFFLSPYRYLRSLFQKSK